jgi:hypothetical protein
MSIAKVNCKNQKLVFMFLVSNSFRFLKKLKTVLLLNILFLSANQNFGQTLSPNASVSVLTCDSGNELYSLFGHTALRISDPENSVDAVYNYGYFDFATPNFYLKFIKGDLQYFVDVNKYEAFLSEYIYFQRGVYEQKLNLSAAQKQKIFDDLNLVLVSDQRFYFYKFIDRNCTTMIVDILNKNLTNSINTKIKDADKTNRTILFGYLNSHFYENLGINIMFGLKTDEDFDHIFLPLQLMEGIKKSINNNQVLCNSTEVVNVKSAPEPPFSISNSWIIYVFVLGFVILINKKSVYLTYLILNGILGVFLFTIGFISMHNELSLNFNILLFNPLYLFLVYFVIKNNMKLIQKTVLVLLGLLILFLILMVNKVHLVMFIPFIITNLVLLNRIYFSK